MNNIEASQLLVDTIKAVKHCADTLKLGDEILVRENNPLTRIDIGMQQSVAYDALERNMANLTIILSEIGLVMLE